MNENELAGRKSARERILELFKAKVGQIVEGQEIRQVAGISEWARRVRELRDEFGWDISSFKDDVSLRPGQYRLESLEQGVISPRRISDEQRRRILERDNYSCQYFDANKNAKCSLKRGEKDTYRKGKIVSLEIDHLEPISLGGDNSDENLKHYAVITIN